MAQVGLKIIPLLFLAMRRITYLLCNDCELLQGVSTRVPKTAHAYMMAHILLF
jgi:hypothetical protein